MPELERAKQALRRAHEAGDADAARRLASYIRKNQQQTQVEQIRADGGIGGQMARMGEGLGAMGKQAVYGFNEGLANVARPFDEMARAPGMGIERVETPGVPSRLQRSPGAMPEGPGIAELLEGLPQEPAETAPQRVARSAGEFAGETTPYTGGLLGLAAKYAQPAKEAAGPLGQRVAQSFLDAVGRAPGTAAVVDAAASLGAGAGGELGEGSGIGQAVASGGAGALGLLADIDPAERVYRAAGDAFGFEPPMTGIRRAAEDSRGVQVGPGADRVLGELIGGVATPMAPFVAPGVTGARLATRGIEAFSPERQARRARDHVADVMGEQLAAPGTQRGLVEGERLRAEIPGFNPSLAESTGSPALVATQRGTERRMQGPELDEAMLRREANEEALALEAARRAPGETADPAVALRGVDERIGDLSGRVGQQQEAAAARATALQRQIDEARAGTAAEREALEVQRRQAAEGRQDQTAEVSQGQLARQDAIETVQRERAAELDALRARADQRAREIAETLPERISRADLGAGVRDRVVAARRDARAQMDARADELGINEINFTAPFRAFADDVAAQVGPRSEWRRQNAGPRTEIYDDIMRFADQETVDFRSIKDLREDVGAALRDAQSGTAPNAKQARELAVIRDLIDRRLLSENALPESEAYRQFRQEYFQNVIEPFEQGAALGIRQRTPQGFHRTLDEDVAASFTNSQSNARQYQRLFGDNPQAMADLEATLVDDLVSSAVRDGVVNPAAVDAWMRRKSGVLAELPAVHQRFEETQAVVRDMDRAFRETDQQIRRARDQQLADLRRERLQLGQRGLDARTDTTRQTREIDARIREVEAQGEDRVRALGEQLQPVLNRGETLKARQRQIEDSNLARRLKAVARHQQTPEDLIGEAVRKPALMTQLLHASRNDPGAQRALKRNVWDRAASMDGEGLLRFITDNRPALQRLFGDTHLKSLEDIQSARMMIERVPPPPGQEILMDPVEMVKRATGHNPQAAVARYIAVSRGRSSKAVEFGAAMSYWFRNFTVGNREKLMKEALYNPRVARDLAEMVRTGDPKVFKPMKAYGWLMNVSGGAFDDDR